MARLPTISLRAWATPRSWSSSPNRRAPTSPAQKQRRRCERSWLYRCHHTAPSTTKTTKSSSTTTTTEPRARRSPTGGSASGSGHDRLCEHAPPVPPHAVSHVTATNAAAATAVAARDHEHSARALWCSCFRLHHDIHACASITPSLSPRAPLKTPLRHVRYCRSRSPTRSWRRSCVRRQATARRTK